MIYTPGPGDILGQYSGHPHDPRTPDDGSDDTTAEAINMVRALVVSAAASEVCGDRTMAEKKMVAARNMINELLGQKA
jgi:hypothetical protein